MIAAARGALNRLTSRPIFASILGVQRRYSDDDGGHRAAAIAYYAFFSVFPLLLLSVAALGFVIAARPSLANDLQAKITTLVPGLGAIASENLGAVERGKAAAGILALAGLLWSGVALAEASSASLSRIFRIKRPSNILKSKARALSTTIALGALGLTGVAVAAATAAIPGDGLIRIMAQGAGTCLVLALDGLLFLVAYRLLAPGRGPEFSRLWPGAAIAAAGWVLLKLAGGWFATRVVGRSSAVYGAFASTIGLLVILNLAARFFLYGAELNAFLGERSGAGAANRFVTGDPGQATSMAEETLDDRVPKKSRPQERRVASRAAAYEQDENGPENAERAARALLSESDARTDEDPAVHDPDDDRIDRRTSEMTTPPPEMTGTNR